MHCSQGSVLIGQTCYNIAVTLGIVATAMIALGWGAGWFSRAYFERRRVQNEKEVRRSGVEREALELAMAWLDPMTLAIMKAEDIAFAYLFGRIDRSQFKVKWPKDLPKRLEALEVPSHLRIYLPDGIQQRGTSVIAMFMEFHSRVSRADTSDNDQVFEALHYGQDIRKHIDELRKDLEAAHRLTLE